MNSPRYHHQAAALVIRYSRTACVAAALLLAHVSRAAGVVRFTISDAADGKAMPARVHLFGADGQAVNPEVKDLPFFNDHVVCDGSAEMRVTAGKYRYEIERGPAWNDHG